ncbi:hypothetical protein HOF78_01800 [Candidatus Woesearchaeota archaeon]|jgi:hypothetical protein|nr:hypothetical protein [Candidatus Woesearchaeota archaeon]
MKKDEISYDLKLWGTILIIMGLLHQLLSGFLSSSWGYLLIFIGALALYIRERRMYLLLGAMMFVVGLSNTAFGSGSWNIYGVMQLVFGVLIFKDYWKKQ